MRLLFDEMLSYKLPRLLGDLYPGSVHVYDIEMEEESDVVIWQYARDYDYIVTSKDTDHVELSERWGFPPKLILVQIGNVPTPSIVSALRSQHQDILAFSQDEDSGIYELW